MSQYSSTTLELNRALFSSEQVREIDRRACETLPCTEFELMTMAAQAAFDHIQAHFVSAAKILIICGKGNNGGDGLVLACLLGQVSERYESIQVCLDGAQRARMSTPVAEQALAQAKQHEALQWVDSAELEGVLKQADLVVDAIFGIGVKGELRSPYDQWLELINEHAKRVLCLDLPSGLCADTGSVASEAIQATHTLSFIAWKAGLFLNMAYQYRGEVFLADLNLPESVYDLEAVQALRFDSQGLASAKKQLERNPCQHKNQFGRVMIVGGDQGMGGAAILSAKAAARTGAGIVHFASQPEHQTAMLMHCPDVLAHKIASGQQLEVILDLCDVIVVGPGTVNSAWTDQITRAVLLSEKPLVIDAGALMVVDRLRHLLKPEISRVLLPHPGEAARLLECSPADIQADRLAAVRALSEKYQSTAILKGAGTLVCAWPSNEQQGAIRTAVVHDQANAALATAGSGDVLAGIIGGLMAQHLTAEQATHLAIEWHLQAAQHCLEQKTAASILASDLVDALPSLMLSALSQAY